MHRTLFAAIAAVALTACSVPSGHFQIEGQFKGLNQGQFLLYSIDARHERIDTLRLNNGKVAYDIPLEDTVVMMLLSVFFLSLQAVSTEAITSPASKMVLTFMDFIKLYPFIDMRNSSLLRLCTRRS